MAEITLRIRQVTPGFWADEDLAKLSETQRLCYIGLWAVADDSGWFPWKPAEIGYHLGFSDKVVRSTVQALKKLPGRARVVIAPCRRHAQLTNLTEYQRYAKSTHNVTRHEREHAAECIPQIPHVSPTSSPPESHGSPTRNGKGTERNRNGGGTGEPSSRRITQGADGKWYPVEGLPA